MVWVTGILLNYEEQEVLAHFFLKIMKAKNCQPRSLHPMKKMPLGNSPCLVKENENSSLGGLICSYQRKYFKVEGN